tara:strand:+ start:10681 stop:11385 length:705 start_codon:yes stop_codon:yes gene_type:complete
MNIAIVQSRMGSKRLPGKMMMRIGRYTLIEWVIKRLKKSKSINKIILVTSQKRDDQIFKNISQKLKINFFAGNEKDVLGRFVNSVKKVKKANIIRVCADKPFIEPREIDRLIKFYKNKNYDYVCNRQIFNNVYCTGFGAEILSLDLLRKLDKLVKKKTFREHVTLYLWKNKKKFKLYPLEANKGLAHPNLNFDIDFPRDYKMIKNLVEKFNININTQASKIISYRLKELKEINK